MTNDNHPITPPLELRLQWKQEWLNVRPSVTTYDKWMLTKSAQWGYEQRAAVNEAELQKARDEELEACVEWVINTRACDMSPGSLRTARRPKPPSLKERIATAIAHGDSSIALALLDQALPD